MQQIIFYSTDLTSFHCSPPPVNYSNFVLFYVFRKISTADRKVYFHYALKNYPPCVLSFELKLCTLSREIIL